MNLRRTMNKLQTALCQKGYRIQINQQQHYSEASKKMATKYIVKGEQECDGRKRTVTLLETYKQAEVVKMLADLYSGGG